MQAFCSICAGPLLEYVWDRNLRQKTTNLALVGVTMWYGFCSSNCTINSPKSLSAACMFFLAKNSFNPISSVTMDLDFTTVFAFMRCKICSISYIASCASFAQMTLMLFFKALLSNSGNNLSKFSIVFHFIRWRLGKTIFPHR